MCSPGIDGQPVDGSFIDTSDASALVQINKSKTEGGCLVASWLSVLVWNHQCGNRLNSLFPWCDSNVLFSFAGPQILCTFCGDRQATGPNAGAVHPRGQRHRSSRRRLHLPHRPRELCLQLWMSQGTTICMFRPVSFFFFSRYFVSYVISQQTTPLFDVLHTFFHSIPVGWSVNIRSTTTTIYLALFSLSLYFSLHMYRD